MPADVLDDQLRVQAFLAEAMDPPATETVTLAMERLKTLGAIAEVDGSILERARRRAEAEENANLADPPDPDSSSVEPSPGIKEVLTPLGSLLSQLPLDPATGRMLIGVVTQCLDPVLTALRLACPPGIPSSSPPGCATRRSARGGRSANDPTTSRS